MFIAKITGAFAVGDFLMKHKKSPNKRFRNLKIAGGFG